MVRNEYVNETDHDYLKELTAIKQRLETRHPEVKKAILGMIKAAAKQNQRLEPLTLLCIHVGLDFSDPEHFDYATTPEQEVADFWTYYYK
ncbi:MAG: hypothetical protein ACFFC7_10515 [Candidatus Hermodarchaeota archaeon]